jgi:membrane-associated protease RseP (regulator of RpoE activity)
MSLWLGVVLFAISIIAVVMVHEAGHFFAARAFGIKVQEFFVGFGPRLWSIRRGETEYGIKAIPAGGYVRIAGMNPYEEIPPEEVPRTFGAKPAWQRGLVLAAGPVTHFVMAILALAIFFTLLGVPSRFQPVIAQVVPTLNGGPSPARLAGLKPGDAVLKIDGQPLTSTDAFVRVTRAHVGEPVTLTVERDGRQLTVTVTPVLADVGGGKRAGRLGVTVTGGRVLARERTNPFVGIGRAVIQTGVLIKAVFVRLGDVFGPAGLKRIGQLLFGSAPRTPNDVASVVGGARLAGEAVQAGAWDALFQLFVLFNVFIGILNLLPLPPFDGGHLAVLAVEKIRGRKVDVRKLVPLTALVAAFMILFALSVVYIDIVKPLPNPFR